MITSDQELKENRMKICIIQMNKLKLISSVDRKSMRISFNVDIRQIHDKPLNWFVQKIKTYLIHLNDLILQRLTNNHGKNSNYIT